LAKVLPPCLIVSGLQHAKGAYKIATFILLLDANFGQWLNSAGISGRCDLLNNPEVRKKKVRLASKQGRKILSHRKSLLTSGDCVTRWIFFEDFKIQGRTFC
jgi:hypothetical protein